VSYAGEFPKYFDGEHPDACQASLIPPAPPGPPQVIGGMPYLRQRPRVPAGGRVTVRMSPSQRDLFTGTRETPNDLAFALRKAPVRGGELSIRVGRGDLDALIAIAARATPPDKREARRLETFIRYLEKFEDRFEDE
jgi:hypothetical protein